MLKIYGVETKKQEELKVKDYNIENYEVKDYSKAICD
jgi:hypothetical protein